MTALSAATCRRRAAAVPGHPTTMARGRFVAQWARQRDGRWLLRRLLFQPSQ
jgi:uncharacterized protein YjiS (DUF1127 family)